MRMSLQPTTSGVLQNVSAPAITFCEVFCVLTPVLNARPALDFYESC
jgi:hypothetical protein